MSAAPVAPPRPAPAPGALRADLEAALLRELRAVWHRLNDDHFGARLRPPVLALSDTTARLGRWTGADRGLELSRQLVVERPWGQVVEVLKHEMAHQYVDEVLGVRDEPAHGPAFRELCERLGVDGAAAGLPSAPPRAPHDPPGVDAATPRVLARVAKLLALAESPNEHEAQLAMAEAQRLMLRHNLEAPPARAYTFRHLGRATGRVTEAERILSAILAEHFFVEAIWVPVWRPLEGRRASVLEICGTPANVEMAAYAHAFVGHAAEELWRAYRARAGVSSNRERRTFLAGVMRGFDEKLAAGRAECRAQGLVWVGDADLRRYYRRRHPHIRSVRGSGVALTEAHLEGRAAGRNLVLHRPIGGDTRARGRLLGPAR